MDREKVLTWLEICGKNNDCSGCCPYSENGIGEYGQCRESLMADAYDLLKEQDERIKQLESMNVTASGNATAIGIVKGGLVIGKQTAKEIHNIKHVEVMNL